MFLPRDQVAFAFGPAPVLLMGGAPVHGLLPVLRGAGDGTLPVCDGWRIEAGVTMLVVDGPGDDGLLIQGAVDVDDARDVAAWGAAVQERDGALVLSLDELPERPDWPRLLNDGIARGGFMTKA
ncbi:hypothetical protein O4J56_25170 [Nocardiopsis sp. RSe5-2]|uniref:Uncharacterized protein n=1 Tax=Nocardiopsis endophytica TaxID=3018445 RepID=A0ABT4UAI9_9ACTN|nr:hypothetical protein [Nocardiopsis endophytica]MDA2813961.1 hypothetical protein [Nocardiopsis endophytica]